VPVHTYGNICEMNEINDIAKKYNLIVLEDCAESLFSKYNDKHSGTLGDVSSYSFQATKTITTGEGGMVVTGDEELNKKMFLIRSHGLPYRGNYLHTEPGHNFRLTNMQAAMGVAQLEYMEKIISERNRIYNRYSKNLNNQEGIIFQKILPNVDFLMWATSVIIDNKIFKISRDEIINKLKEKMIEIRPGFVSSSYIKYFDKHKLNISEYLSDNVISLPSFASLTNQEIDYISDSLLKLKQ
jgi:perosamine synthetase